MPPPEPAPGERVREAARLFNDRRYYEAHDVLEEAWADARGPRRRRLQALVKVAAGMYHLQTSNLPGAESLLAAGLDALARTPSPSGIEVGEGLWIVPETLSAPAGSALRKVRLARAGRAADWGPEDLPRLQLRAETGQGAALPEPPDSGRI